jgi:DNA (cytosine-5)-methyltransferase 1
MSEHLFDPNELDRQLPDESQACNLASVGDSGALGGVAGLFAGIGGIEHGLRSAGFEAELLCESWSPAQAVIRHHFDGVPLVGDVCELRSLPRVEVVTAGFPCQDLSQAGRTAGINGERSGLVAEVFRLLRRRHPRWLVLENVQFMLQLEGGRGMRYLVDLLEAMKYRWAYRVVDSRFTGVPQRRRRVVLVASRNEDPRTVLFADNAGEPPATRYRDDAFGFYWTEGLRGLGWAVDAVPTLKGGSSIGIPSPPGVWVPSTLPGRRVVVPGIEDAEAMQGFDRGWTNCVPARRELGTRWKLVGNAVTVGVSRWLGSRLREPGSVIVDEAPLESGSAWPTSAWGANGHVFRVDASEYPRLDRYRHLSEVIDLSRAAALSRRGAAGFFSRTQRAKLRFVDQFLADVAEHAENPSEQALPIPA